MAYHGGDAVAIYGLATLFNRHKGDEATSSNKALEVAWAPILLIHLGGCDGVTAYNIEDNELWTRHLLTAVSQVTVAIYVFSKSWPFAGGDKRMLLAAILLFITGIVKCFVKVRAFQKASINSMVSSKANENDDDKTYDLAEYVKLAKGIVEGPRVQAENPYDAEASKLFVDLSSSYHRRISIMKMFCGFTEERAYVMVKRSLAGSFLILYTKLRTAANKGQFIWIARMVLPFASIGLFHHSHREAYNHIDVKITYALFCCTAVLELYSWASVLSVLVNLVSSNSYESSSKVWPEIVPQYSLAGYFVRNRKHSNVMRIVSLLGCKDFLDQHWCMKPCFSSARIIELVHQYLKDGWKGRIQGPASYRSFNNHSNHWGLNMNRPFDECVLLWHLATDFCFFLSSFPEHASDKNQTTSQCRQKGWAMNQTQFLDPFISRQMSNYMVYLLFVNPEMLLPGTRRNLFDTAHNDLKATLSGWEWNPACSSRWTPKEIKPLVEEETVMHGLIKVMQEKSEKMTCQEESLREAYTVITIKQEKLEESNKEGNFIDQAWALAQRLTKMGEKKMWDQIQDVWVQMLCFSASRGRGYLHAKALGKGGEFLSYVWFLLFLMGMETLSERLQRDLLPSSQGNNGTAAPPSAFEVSTIGTAPMASEVSTIRFRAPHHDRRHSVDF
ncbi:hypothetical protein HU200_053808 [Digitaria exilis]|uniref:DUF4220 domain-containing protein n=1 Tax=Digitaria exilis TaxID=1010633 RepID=A0A835AWC9_9POAL|nr:hypothetical protein HU200_053808 [Digitaria exilis]